LEIREVVLVVLARRNHPQKRAHVLEVVVAVVLAKSNR